MQTRKIKIGVECCTEVRFKHPFCLRHHKQKTVTMITFTSRSNQKKSNSKVYMRAHAHCDHLPQNQSLVAAVD